MCVCVCVYRAGQRGDKQHPGLLQPLLWFTVSGAGDYDIMCIRICIYVCIYVYMYKHILCCMCIHHHTHI